MPEDQGTVWVVHGTIDSVPFLKFFPERESALEFLKDACIGVQTDNLAVSKVGGVDSSQVSVRMSFTLGWVQDLVRV